jgi:hypothetical protein
MPVNRQNTFVYTNFHSWAALLHRHPVTPPQFISQYKTEDRIIILPQWISIQYNELTSLARGFSATAGAAGNRRPLHQAWCDRLSFRLL